MATVNTSFYNPQAVLEALSMCETENKKSTYNALEHVTDCESAQLMKVICKLAVIGTKETFKPESLKYTIECDTFLSLGDIECRDLTIKAEQVILAGDIKVKGDLHIEAKKIHVIGTTNIEKHARLQVDDMVGLSVPSHYFVTEQIMPCFNLNNGEIETRRVTVNQDVKAATMQYLKDLANS